MLLSLAIFKLWQWWRYSIRPFFEKIFIKQSIKNYPAKKKIKTSLRLLSALYKGVNSSITSLKERKRLAIKDTEFIYGEIDFLSFFTILEKVKPQPGEIFYDLGCGSGKAVFAAAFYFDLSKSCGIELLPALYILAIVQIEKAENLIKLLKQSLAENYLHKISCIQFINDNFLNCNISDGDIIFINATCLSYYTWEAVVEKLTLLKHGSRVIVTTKKIHHEQFQLLSQNRELMSWGMNSVNIYMKIFPS
jgi:precorrin-6B methylase 2